MGRLRHQELCRHQRGLHPDLVSGVSGGGPVRALTYALGLSGNAATVFGGNQGLGNYSVGLGADVHQKYRVDLKYIDVGRYKDNGTSRSPRKTA